MDLEQFDQGPQIQTSAGARHGDGGRETEEWRCSSEGRKQLAQNLPSRNEGPLLPNFLLVQETLKYQNCRVF